MIRRGIGVQSFVSAGGGTDADAQAFITAAGITDATQQLAINTLVTDLKGYGIWSKMKAIYPMVGGTSSTHKWNLKDPRDLDAAYRLVFSGGWTHSSTGALPNGTNAYADTFLNPDNTLTLNNTHLSFYSRTNSNGLFCDIGGTDNNVSFLPLFKIIPRYNGDFLGYSYSFQSGQFVQNAVADSNGLMIISRTSSTSFKSFKNGTVLGSTTTAQNQTRILGRNVLIGASAAVTIAEYSNRQCAFASIGDGLTDTEAANLYTAVQAYQTSLSRNV